MTQKYKARHSVMCERLEKIPHIQFIPALGGFYILVEASQLIKKLQLSDDLALTQFLLEKAHVSVVPGSAFGAENHIRLSFATNKTKINLAFDRIEAAIQQASEILQDNS